MSVEATLPRLQRRNSRRQRILWALVLGLLAAAILSLLLGRYPTPGLISWRQLANDELAARLIFSLRLPRLLTALLLGVTLSAAGMVFQLLFTNPLVEPGFLGVSQGAAFGAAFAILFLGHSMLALQSSAAFFALTGLGFSYLLARRLRYGGWILRLVQLPEITYWLLGGLAGITWGRFLSVLPVVLPGLIILYFYRWRLNLLALNEETAFSLGAVPGRERLLLIVAAVLPTAALISITGIIGWVGLIMPHIARRLFAADARFSLPAAMLLGGLFTLLCDDLARTLLSGEIPLGILTALFGAVIFLGLMMSQRVAQKAKVRR
jgi:iron complex transport system permease protein